MWSKHRKFSTWSWTWWPHMWSSPRPAFTTGLRTSCCWTSVISRSESVWGNISSLQSTTQNPVFVTGLIYFAFWVALPVLTAISTMLYLKTNFKDFNLCKSEFCFFRCPVKARKICRSCRRVPVTLKTLCPERTTASMCSLAAYSSFTANQVQTIQTHEVKEHVLYICISLHKTVWATVWK